MTADIILDNGVLKLIGELTYQTVEKIFNRSVKLLIPAKQKVFVFDFSNVTQSDSSSVALLIELLKLARKEQLTISFQNLSNDIQLLIHAARMDMLLNFK